MIIRLKLFVNFLLNAIAFVFLAILSLIAPDLAVKAFIKALIETAALASEGRWDD